MKQEIDPFIEASEGASSCIENELLDEVPEAREIADYNCDSDFCFTDEYAEMKARMKDCFCEHADDTTLQLDLDGEAAYELYHRQANMLSELGILHIKNAVQRRSRNGNRHVTLTLNHPLDIQSRIMYQALLGSDIKREMLSLAGLLKGRQVHPILFFRPLSEQPKSEEVVF